MYIPLFSDVFTLVHIEWLWFLALPLPVYLENPSSLEGAVLPAIVSIVLLVRYFRKIKDKRLIFGFLLFAWTIGLSTEQWGVLGLHIFTASLIVWPLLVFLLDDDFPWPLAYPMAYISTLLPDVYGAGAAAHWRSGWFFGVGGAGFQDGLFLVPLKAVIAAFLLHYLGLYLKQKKLFHSAKGD